MQSELYFGDNESIRVAFASKKKLVSKVRHGSFEYLIRRSLIRKPWNRYSPRERFRIWFVRMFQHIACAIRVARDHVIAQEYSMIIFFSIGDEERFSLVTSPTTRIVWHMSNSTPLSFFINAGDCNQWDQATYSIDDTTTSKYVRFFGSDFFCNFRDIRFYNSFVN